MTELQAIRMRHSVRKYQDRPLDATMISKLQEEICRLNNEGDLRMQLVLNEKKAFQGILSYGKFSNVSNYIMVVGKKSESLDYRAGYYGEKLVVYAEQLGLNTCFVGLTYKRIDGAFHLGDDEKILVCIAIGYGDEKGIKRHKIKRPDQVSNVNEASPEWFKAGVDAALLAPTAVNQQKFYFELIMENKVRPCKGRSLVGYTKIDLGIAMCNFEIGAGKNNFKWEDSPLK